jgi:tetratricopeptide (TPR) repeat protein
LFENLDDFNYTTIKDLKEIKLPEIKGTTLDIAKLVKDTISNGDAAYQKKDYLLALNSFRDARDTLASISSEERKKTGNLGDEVQNRIYLAGDALFGVKLNELDMYYKENSPMSLKAINRGRGLEGWKSLYGEYGKELKEGERNPKTEKRIVKNINELSERKFRFLMEEEERSGDEKLAKGKYDSAISYYEDALEIVRNSEGALGEKESTSLKKKLADARAKRWNTEMEELYAKIEKKSEELWKDGEYPDYIEYLKEKVNKLNDLKDKGGTKSELVTSITNKINKYGEILFRHIREKNKTHFKIFIDLI